MIRKFYILFTIAISTTMLFAQAQTTIDWQSLANSPWPAFRGDMQGTGRSINVGPKTANVIWRADLPLGILWGPAIGYDDILYFGTNSVDTSNHNKFYAYYPTGELYWINETDSFVPNDANPIVTSDSTVYMNSNHGFLYAFTIDGQLKWKLQVGDGYRFSFAIAKNGIIYTTGLTTKIVSPAGYIIKEKLIEYIITEFSFSPSGDTIYYRTGNSQIPGYLNAADLDLNLLWRYKLSKKNYAAPLVDNNNNIYVYGEDTLSSEEALFCLKDDGTVKWKYDIDNFRTYNSPTMDAEGNIIFFAHKDGKKIISLNYAGELNWEYLLDSQNDDIDHGLVCDAEGTIYCGATYPGYFYAISSEGQLLWKLLMEYEFDGCPAIGSDGTLYIGLNSSTFFTNHTQNLIAIKDDPTVFAAEDPLPTAYNLFQNYPNPFNPTTVIKYTIPKIENRESVIVQLIVYDILGNEISTLVNEPKPTGTYEIEFSSHSGEVRNLPSGVYFYKLTTGKFTETKKMLLLK